MLTIDIPNRPILRLNHAVFDYNGTIALDGLLETAVLERLKVLQASLSIHILTADTHGTVRSECAPHSLHVATFPEGLAAPAKRDYVRSLGGGVVCVGNGFNDIGMCREADLAIAVLGREGLAAALIEAADIVTASAADAIDLLLHPDRLRATLRG